ncbi:MAG: MarR family transcriptional regulator [Aquabacterium sp.]|jgi:DNA-binding MarR family transcriptional regulator|uniref:MarR family winged helix-turn-helix transcriptional regulator n=1 Tax=Aquabacterium sp. TaxID=1872578 RepID=UPI002A35EF8B|nr:MarR family transcriptional regulator [Aquabacterium sp.]MDX9845313.1 MarR family transcriptional regulator [Aquabacterium sp.]
MSSSPAPIDAQALEELPGFYIRRLQQIAVAIFLEETQEFGVTPVQFAALTAIQREPGLDQRTLAGRIGFDTSTLGSVIDRLEARGLVVRSNSPSDRRVRLLHLTEAGITLLRDIDPSMRKAQLRMLAPLPPEQRLVFMDMLRTLLEANNVLSRAPSQA